MDEYHYWLDWVFRELLTSVADVWRKSLTSQGGGRWKEDATIAYVQTGIVKDQIVLMSLPYEAGAVQGDTCQ